MSISKTETSGGRPGMSGSKRINTSRLGSWSIALGTKKGDANEDDFHFNFPLNTINHWYLSWIDAVNPFILSPWLLINQCLYYCRLASCSLILGFLSDPHKLCLSACLADFHPADLPSEVAVWRGSADREFDRTCRRGSLLIFFVCVGQVRSIRPKDTLCWVSERALHKS